MDRRDEEEANSAKPFPEPLAWIGCLLAAIMPTAVLSTIALRIDRSVWPPFGMLLYVGVFTVMVLIVRPWTMR